MNRLRSVLYSRRKQLKSNQFAEMTQTVPLTPPKFVRAYLRISTTQQEAQRARGSIDVFAQERDISICNYYIENESGALLDRPELFKLLNDCYPSDILLVEDINRLSRLRDTDSDLSPANSTRFW